MPAMTMVAVLPAPTAWASRSGCARPGHRGALVVGDEGGGQAREGEVFAGVGRDVVEQRVVPLGHPGGAGRVFHTQVENRSASCSCFSRAAVVASTLRMRRPTSSVMRTSR